MRSKTFLNDILPNRNSVLIHVSDKEYQYELRDLTNSIVKGLRTQVYEQLFKKRNPASICDFNFSTPTTCGNVRQQQRTQHFQNITVTNAV